MLTMKRSSMYYFIGVEGLLGYFGSGKKIFVYLFVRRCLCCVGSGMIISCEVCRMSLVKLAVKI